MHNEHHTSHEAQGFGKNTNAAGIFIVAVFFIAIGLFTWYLFNNNDMEINHYRLKQTEAASKPSEHGGH